MSSDDIERIIGVLWFIVWAILSIRRYATRKQKASNPPRDPAQRLRPAPQLPPDAERLLAQAAARGQLSASPAQRTNPFAGDPLRENVYNQQNLRETQDLLLDWYEEDETQWSEPAFNVMERILIDRLGRLPARADEAEGLLRQCTVLPGDGIDPRVQRAWIEGDLETLEEVLEQDPDWIVRMDAAEGLAAWGDPRGREYLTDAAQDPADDVRGVAAEILDELAAAPPGLSVQSDEPEAEPARPPEEAVTPNAPMEEPLQEPASTGDIWAAYRDKQALFEQDQAAKAPGARPADLPGAGPMRVNWAAASEASPVTTYLIIGGLGGSLGFLGFYLLSILGGQPGLQALQLTQFVRSAPLWLLPLDVALGAGVGLVGSLLSQSVPQSLVQDSEERPAFPWVWVVLAGAVAAAAANALVNSLIPQ